MNAFLQPAPLLLAAIFLAGSPALLCAQGALTPPGAPAPTMRSLDQLDGRIPISASTTPGDAGSTFIISSSGSYYLTGNVTGTSGRHGISVNADNVTIDLRGYTLTGVAGALAAINCPARAGLSIRDGYLLSWPAGGIAGSSLSRTMRVEGVTAETCGGAGITVGERSVVLRCISRGNTGGATSGIAAFQRSVVSQCVAEGNGQHGFVLNGESVLTDCVATNNTGNGINLVAHANRVSGTLVSANGGAGIAANGQGNAAVSCTARNNVGIGFSLSSDALVQGCDATGNNEGIVCSAGSVILNNVCNLNNNGGTGAGIRTSSANSRIEGNTCRSNGQGIVTAAAPNLIVRNHCGTNGTNYNLAGGTNSGAGTITVVTSVPGSNANANFDF